VAQEASKVAVKMPSHAQGLRASVVLTVLWANAGCGAGGMSLIGYACVALQEPFGLARGGHMGKRIKCIVILETRFAQPPGY
jgi:hypothetical protein